MGSNWHSLCIDDVLPKLTSRKSGITDSDAQKRLGLEGPNSIEVKKPVSPLALLARQFKSFIVWFLIIAGTLSLVMFRFTGELEHELNAAVIFFVIVINAAMGFFQEYRANRTAEMLSRMIVKKAVVIRDGKEKVIDTSELVPGDVIVLSEGAQVPADSRLFEANDIYIDESAMTGESVPVLKRVKPVGEDVPLAERKCIAYSGTFVIRGSGKAVVFATGMNSEMGKIAAEALKRTGKQGSFEQEIDTAGRTIGMSVAAIILLVAVSLIFFHGMNMYDVLLISIALAVGAIPEGLPAVVTLTLSLGSKRMGRRNCLVKKLPVVESMGAVDVICTDKTGTLTENKMKATRYMFGGEVLGVEREPEHRGGWEQFLDAAAICNDLADEKGTAGDPLEVALESFARSFGHSLKRRKEFPEIGKIEFNSERKMMSTINGSKRGAYVFTKGASERVLACCDSVLLGGKTRKLTSAHRRRISEIEERFASDTLRVIAIAYKKTRSLKRERAESGLVFLGLIGMHDPPKPEARQAVYECNLAGIRVIMLTGDSKGTAQHIAKEVGIGQNALEGADLDRMSDGELNKTLETTTVFARVSPQHKLRVLKALQAKGLRVALTGDGVNDVPALKNADIGIAMGLRGTDIAKETADVVLLDDNFSTIVAGIKEGRTIFTNIQKFVNYLLTANLGEVFAIFTSAFTGLLPITAIQLLWVNFITDIFPAAALGADPPAPNTMSQKPRGKDERIINKRWALIIGAVAAKKAIVTLVLFYAIYWSTGNLIEAQSISFTWVVLSHFVRISAVRAEEGIPFFSNKWVTLSLLFSTAMQLVILYTPMAIFFNVMAPDMYEWAMLIIAMLVGRWLAITITKKIVEMTPKHLPA